MSSVHLRGTSTETVPNTNASGGSVVADLNGLAVKVKPPKVASFTSPLGSDPWLGIRREESFISQVSSVQGRVGTQTQQGRSTQQFCARCSTGHQSSYFHPKPPLSSPFCVQSDSLPPARPSGDALSPSQFIVFRSGFLNPEQHAQKIHVLPPVFSSVQGSSC